MTAAPLVIKDKVITGRRWSDLPTRGFLDAYDAATGKRAWRFYDPGAGRTGARHGRTLTSSRGVAVRRG